jgi:hypothetical protein
MKKWLIIVAGVGGGLLLFFGVSFLLVGLLLTDDGLFGSGDAVGVVEVKGIILDSHQTASGVRQE